MLAQMKSQKLYQELQKEFSKKINLDLKRVNKALKKLGNIHKLIRNPINIIGSDGKYSTLRSLQFFLEENKQKVSTFTSPHLYDVRHRFWLKNSFIGIKELKKNIQIIKKLKVKLTLFEVLTLVYYISAAKLKGVSFALVEAGLLFAGESTRVWDEPKAQIITNINKQHLEWVNPKTIKEICRQKVGYLSKKTTIYVGKQKPNTMEIIKKILKKNPSNKIFYGIDWILKKEKKNIIYKDKKGKIKLYSKNVYSKGIWDNIGLSIKVARDLNVPTKTILKAMKKIKFEGRMQYLKNGKLKKLLYPVENILVDGCHSEVSAENLSSYLKNVNHDLYGILGIQSHKQPENFVKKFKGIFKKIVAVRIPDEPKSCDTSKLKKILIKNNIKCSSAPNIKSAFQQLSSNKNKLIVCFGSLYLVGKVLSLN
jgi:dihydrofolate synthase / folylpolyglutamate synthase